MSIKFIDLFSGCGGLTEAFLNNKKFSPIKIIDNDKFCYDTTINRLKKLRFKNPETIAELQDISNSKTINNFKNISSDLHDQFDRGYFTITDELKIKVHESLKDKQIFRLNGKIISIPEDFEPNKKYLKIHQKFVFGRMKPISREKPTGLQKFFENNNYLF